MVLDIIRYPNSDHVDLHIFPEFQKSHCEFLGRINFQVIILELTDRTYSRFANFFKKMLFDIFEAYAINDVFMLFLGFDKKHFYHAWDLGLGFCQIDVIIQI